ncbi:MAG: sulfotransferase [Sphingomicrobium sp.]|nr:sulfotransferase [Sphingomonadales bacterium]
MSSLPPPYLLPALEAFRNGDLVLARAEAERALAENSGAVPLLHLNGVVCCRLGDLHSGIRHLEAALAVEPDRTDIRIVLARALFDNGQVRRAFEKAVGRNHPELIAVEAEASRALEDHVGEAAALGRLIAFRPRDAALRRAQGHALAKAGNMDAATEALDYAIQLHPDSIDTRVELATLLADIDQLEAALLLFRDSRTIAPDRADLVLGEARVLVKLRRFEEAETTYMQALDISPALPEATREYGLMLERMGRIDELPPLLDCALTAGVPAERLSLLRALLAFRDKQYRDALALASQDMDDDSVRRWRLIAKIYEAEGDMPSAFDAANAMNLAAPDHAMWRDRGASARAEIRRLAVHTTATWARSLPVDEPGPRRSPAFIVGFPRSGTTLLDTFLMGHPDVRVLEEEPLLEAAKSVVGDLAQLPTIDAATIAHARDAYFHELDQRVDLRFTGLVVDKMPFNMLGAGLIHRLFPDARIVFAQRHPCDVVLSGFMQSFRLNDGMASFLHLADAADLYDAAMSLWMASREYIPLAVHDLVYEHLVEDPMRNLRAVIAFLGLPWDNELLDHQATAKRRGAIITPSYDQVTQPISRRAVGRWRSVSDKLGLVLPTLLEWAERLGYESDGKAIN